MNVFVTGGAGYIGSICTEELLNTGHAVTVYDNLSEGHRSAVDPRAKFIFAKPELDSDILKAVRSAMPDAIMHFAAHAYVGESVTDPVGVEHGPLGHPSQTIAPVYLHVGQGTGQDQRVAVPTVDPTDGVLGRHVAVPR